jgi:hypothetical protein
VSLEWFGEQAKDRVTRALHLGIDKTTSEGAIAAKHLVNRDTTALQGSIYPEPSKVNEEGQVEGVYGPHDIAYAAVQEFLPGEKMPDGSTRERKGGKPYMRPSYEEAKAKLMPNIAAAYRGLS